MKLVDVRALKDGTVTGADLVVSGILPSTTTTTTTIAPPPTPPIVCASKIDVAFDKTTYIVGDNYKLTVKVNNLIPFRQFYYQISDGTTAEGSENTDETGVFEGTGTITERDVGKLVIAVFINDTGPQNQIVITLTPSPKRPFFPSFPSKKPKTSFSIVKSGC